MVACLEVCYPVPVHNRHAYPCLTVLIKTCINLEYLCTQSSNFALKDRHTHSPVPEVVTLYNFVLEKLIVDLPVKEFLTFYRVGRFINGFIFSDDI
jgi:hypothetical protein